MVCCAGFRSFSAPADTLARNHTTLASIHPTAARWSATGPPPRCDQRRGLPGVPPRHGFPPGAVANSAASSRVAGRSLQASPCGSSALSTSTGNKPAADMTGQCPSDLRHAVGRSLGSRGRGAGCQCLPRAFALLPRKRRSSHRSWSATMALRACAAVLRPPNSANLPTGFTQASRAVTVVAAETACAIHPRGCAALRARSATGVPAASAGRFSSDLGGCAPNAQFRRGATARRRA